MASAFFFDFKNDILRILFTRPEAGNSFGIDEAKELQKILKQHEKAKVLIFKSGHPSIFCGGGDLKAHAKFKDKKQGVEQARAICTILEEFAFWPCPKIAIVNGDCFGGGMELLSCFTHRIASSHVMFGFWQRRVGLSFGWGGYKRWADRISADVIKDLSFTARLFGAHEALRLGIVHEVGGMPEAIRWAENSLRWPVSERLLSLLEVKNETQFFEQLWWSDDHQAILKKFSKR